MISPFATQLFGLPDVPGVDGGDITINTPRLNLNDLGLITVRNDGTGDAGNLTINAESISLNNQGGITATTVSGEGGNINLNLKSDLILRNNSVIDTEALGAGNGGNLTINSPVIAGFENSDIIANAVEGKGGNVNITTQGIFGLQFREKLTLESDITASSQFGVNGEVEINNVGIKPSFTSLELPSKITDNTQVESGCKSSSVNRFVVLGRGAFPENPHELFSANTILVNLIDLVYQDKKHSHISPQNNSYNHSNPKTTIVEATGFMSNEKGEIELVALSPTSLPTKKLSKCSGLNT